TPRVSTAPVRRRAADEGILIRMRRSALVLLLACSDAASPLAPAPTAPKTADSYVAIKTPRIVLSHVRVIDGLGHAATDDRNVVVEAGKIAAIEPGADATGDATTTVLDLHGASVLPGLVG